MLSFAHCRLSHGNCLLKPIATSCSGHVPCFCHNSRGVASRFGIAVSSADRDSSRSQHTASRCLCHFESPENQRFSYILVSPLCFHSRSIRCPIISFPILPDCIGDIRLGFTPYHNTRDSFQFIYFIRCFCFTCTQVPSLFEMLLPPPYTVEGP